MKNTLLKKYKNGNANILIYSDGTRVCHTDAEAFDFDYPLNMDVKITNKCSKGCPACHEQSVPNGKNSPMAHFSFLKNWLPGCEVAYGGGSVTEHPQFEDILRMTQEAGLIANTTFHIEEFIDHAEEIKRWQAEGMLHGIGVSWSMTGKEPDIEKLVEVLKGLDHVVFHVIVGIVSRKDIEDINTVCMRAGKPAKVLLLGYKNFGRGKQLFSKAIEARIKDFSDNYDAMIKGLNLISFDNLALGQLNMKNRLSEKEWNLFYQGDEGSSNMYIDAVKGEYAVCSIAEERYKLTEDVAGMFKQVKSSREVQGDVL